MAISLKYTIFYFWHNLRKKITPKTIIKVSYKLLKPQTFTKHVLILYSKGICFPCTQQKSNYDLVFYLGIYQFLTSLALSLFQIFSFSHLPNFLMCHSYQIHALTLEILWCIFFFFSRYLYFNREFKILLYPMFLLSN